MDPLNMYVKPCSYEYIYSYVLITYTSYEYSRGNLKLMLNSRILLLTIKEVHNSCKFLEVLNK